jgi:hypothetical protein
LEVKPGGGGGCSPSGCDAMRCDAMEVKEGVRRVYKEKKRRCHKWRERIVVIIWKEIIVVMILEEPCSIWISRGDLANKSPAILTICEDNASFLSEQEGVSLRRRIHAKLIVVKFGRFEILT